ncbi:maestro heat-like repeat-containing protein family member 1 isoform X2 [Vidua chalybeata]|uniref:maestro heat-like repeat-containing protein family member 1 isoform X2 n=1 Tax=Vidua chalybeata TaxID=81927 RepID=UPI0023A8C199|nr:maestro heat-like repeat-containing protein family member 1 isoform X2 [Vidua chalybeata]
MAEKRQGLFRGKKNKGSSAAPAKQRDVTPRSQPLQGGAALDHKQEQESTRGRFCRTAQMFQQFLRIRHRKTGSTAAAGAAKPDLGLTELQAEPDGSPDLAERSEDSETSVTETWVKALLTSKTEDMAITNSNNEETRGITNTDTRPNSVEHSKDSEAAMNKDRSKAAMAGDVAVTSTKTRETQGLTITSTMPAPTVIHAPTMDFLKESAVPFQQQVPAIVRSIHQRLVSHVSVDARLQMDIVRLAEEHPADVVLTLLRCAPTCDRAATVMWRTIGSSSPTVKKVLPTLLSVMEDWPLHRMFTSDGDDTDVFALAATLVIWVIVQVPECHEAMILYSSRLFVALLFHVVITTQQMPPEEVDNFWRACREEHRFPSKPNRFAVQAMKALLCRLQCDHVVVAMERKHGWDTLLCAHIQHYAVGLLAREMRRVLIPLCSRIALYLLRHLSMEEPCWDLPFLAFLVEVLHCLDMGKCGGTILEMISRHLQSECRERRRLALRGLVVLSKDPSMARRIGILSQQLVDVLGDADGEVVSMSLCVFTNVLQHQDILVSSTTAPKLAEALLPLFDHDSSHVQLLSIQLFCKVMELVVDEGKKPLKTIVNKSLDKLLIYCHDENWHVAQASRETLLRVTKFLKRRALEQLVKKGNLWKFAEVLLAEDRSRAAEHLRRALPYLQSPQESLREAAVRFMGTAGRYLKGQPAELHVLTQALEAMSKDDSPSSTNLEIRAIFGQRSAELRSSAGFREPGSQEEYQETVKRTPPLNVTGAPGTADAGYG